ncbi:hypothetical protein GGTG_13951 [Gaeumannomyces tritici R3-111a-1]|uniref:Uncharacterized protein n=1 Tax=Gaeumannomyces tritici (strain R3-111a-1) TaxID=644352 RepID=J3PKA1_GAET3|nr:hypothetical protein GGTG_13951 [Gaeumannomyces tritici R3-111a-1]EJT68475.1 hypothetical protein GGTG_13951 [Gaeumannomyces tritici R3-111a-1]
MISNIIIYKPLRHICSTMHRSLNTTRTVWLFPRTSTTYAERLDILQALSTALDARSRAGMTTYGARLTPGPRAARGGSAPILADPSKRPPLTLATPLPA